MFGDQENMLLMPNMDEMFIAKYLIARFPHLHHKTPRNFAQFSDENRVPEQIPLLHEGSSLRSHRIIERHPEILWTFAGKFLLLRMNLRFATLLPP
jgi:hypothetical protein